MSYKAEKSIPGRAIIHYPNNIIVEKLKYEGKEYPISISTGPYRKDILGEDGENIPTYLAHLHDKYHSTEELNTTVRNAYRKAVLAKYDIKYQSDKVEINE